MNSIESILSMAESKAMDDILTAQMNHEKFMRNIEFPDQRTNQMSSSDIERDKAFDAFIENEDYAPQGCKIFFNAGWQAAKQDGWQSIETFPKDREILILSNLNNRYVGIWATNVETGNEAFIIGNDGYGNQMVVELENIKSWCELPQLPKE